MANEKRGKKFDEFAIAFLKESKEDLSVAEELIENKRFARSIFVSQQCVEKSIKALLEMENIFVSEHDLSGIFVKFIYSNKKYNKLKKELDTVLENLDYFEGEWSKTRYPKEQRGKVVSPIDIYDLGDAEYALLKAGEVFDIIRKILVTKFKVKLK